MQRDKRSGAWNPRAISPAKRLVMRIEDLCEGNHGIGVLVAFFTCVQRNAKCNEQKFHTVLYTCPSAKNK